MNKISNDRLVIAAVFFRNFSYSYIIVYMSAVFLTHIGGQDWPKVTLYTQFFSLAFVAAAAYLKKKHFYAFQKVMLIALCVSLTTYHFYPYEALVIILVAVFSSATDLIGEITASNAVSNLFNSVNYKNLSPKLVQFASLANVISLLMVVVTQHLDNRLLFVCIGVSCCILYFISFSLITKRSLIKLKENPPPVQSGTSKVKDTIKFSIKSPLVILSICLITWSQISRFFSDWLFMSSVSKVFLSQTEISNFLVASDITIMLIVVVYQKLFAKKIARKNSPTTLLSLVPFTFLIFSSIGILTASPYIGIATDFFFVIIFKGIHNPMLKISMQSLHPSKKARVFLLMNFIISILMMVITFGMNEVKSIFTTDLMYITLILMSVLALVIVARFDTTYLQNLWSNITNKNLNQLNSTSEYIGVETDLNEEVDVRYFNPHHFFMHKYDKQVSKEVKEFIYCLNELPDEDLIESFDDYYDKCTNPFDKMVLILNTYIFSKRENIFKKAISRHHELLNSDNEEDVEKAVQIFSLIDTPEFRVMLDDSQTLKFQKVSQYAKSMMELKSEIKHLAKETNCAHNALLSFIELNWEYLKPEEKNKVKEVALLPYSHNLRILSKWLSQKESLGIKTELINSYDCQKNRIDLNELAKIYIRSNHEKRSQLQLTMRDFKPNEGQKKILNRYIENVLKGDELKENNPNDLLDVLFLIEWANISDTDQNFIYESIEVYPNLSFDEKYFWKDFHLEFLKTTQHSDFARVIHQYL